MDVLEITASQFETALPLGDVIASLIIAALLGGMIGLEREWRGKSAGLRTHMGVTLAAATFALITRDFAAREALAGADGGNPFILIRAVAEASAVIAAASIIASGGKIRGLTTGVGLWLAAAVGLACGIGSFVIAGLATLFTVFVLGAIRYFEPMGQSDEMDR